MSRVIAKQMYSKYPGTCKTCNGRFGKGDSIIWSPDYGVFHEACEIMIGGKTVATLFQEWEEANRDRPTICDRIESMSNDPAYRNVPIEAIEDMAMQDAPQNPYKALMRFAKNQTPQVHCGQHGDVDGTMWDGELVCPYHQRTKQSEEGPVLMYEEFDQDGN